MLIHLLVLMIVFGVGFYVLNLLPLAQPFKQIALAILGLICVLTLFNMMGWLSSPWIIGR